MSDNRTNKHFTHSYPHNNPHHTAHQINYQTESLELHHPISHLLKVCCLGQSVPLYLTQLHSGHCWLLNSKVQGPHHHWHVRCLSGVRSGTTLRRASVQLSKPSDATYSARPVRQPGRGRRLPQPGQLTIGEELLGYHNNNNNKCQQHQVLVE